MSLQSHDQNSGMVLRWLPRHKVTQLPLATSPSSFQPAKSMAGRAGLHNDRALYSVTAVIHLTTMPPPKGVKFWRDSFSSCSAWQWKFWFQLWSRFEDLTVQVIPMAEFGWLNGHLTRMRADGCTQNFRV